MGVAFDVAQAHRQPRLGAIERLKRSPSIRTYSMPPVSSMDVTTPTRPSRTEGQVIRFVV